MQRQGAGRKEDACRLQHHQARPHPHSRRVRRKTVSFYFFRLSSVAKIPVLPENHGIRRLMQKKTWNMRNFEKT